VTRGRWPFAPDRRLGASVTRPGVVEGPAPISQFGVVLAQPAQAATSHARWKRLGLGSPELPAEVLHRPLRERPSGAGHALFPRASPAASR
jgi:hypothetical protein